ncbi:unnamed protein product [Orchesella dallaii]|uniref:Uncharacterized protein n=1 Tax=Orchesella dallaii TaxID=48710 RepID=A0ABP1S0S7_9HEXA
MEDPSNTQSGAIGVAQPTESILLLSNVYKDDEAKDARQKLTSIGVEFCKARSKQNIICEIVNSLKTLDFKGQKVLLAATDLTRICHIPTNIGDEIQIRPDMVRIQQKVCELEEVLKSVRKEISDGLLNLSSKVSTYTSEIQQASIQSQEHITAVINHSAEQSQIHNRKDTFESKVKTKTPREFDPPSTSWGGLDRIRPRMLPIKSKPQEDKPSNPKFVNKEWHHVTYKKKSKAPTFGAAKSVIQAVKAAKTSSVFLSRCTPTTTCDDIRTYLVEEKQWVINDVQCVKTKFQTYRSFQVEIVRTDDKPESEYLKPEH